MNTDKRTSINYDNIGLSVNIDNIFTKDCFVVEDLPTAYFRGVVEPVKFSATACLYLSEGSCRVLINLLEHSITAPCIIYMTEGQILQILDVSEDARASAVVLSDRMVDTLRMYSRESNIFPYGLERNVYKVKDDYRTQLQTVISLLARISSRTDMRFRFQTAAHLILAFIFAEGYEIFYDGNSEARDLSTSARVTEAFLNLVQQHFKQERFLEFYSSKLGITPKHLSRTVKNQTGVTAVDWIIRYVILEAKVMLRSSGLSVNEIATHLNFASQSFFGKYFKRYTGMSPLEFRKGDSQS